jgi:hypothetical protein
MYEAAALNVTISFKNDSKYTLGSAVYNVTSERIVIKAPTFDIEMPTIRHLTIAPEA